MPLTCRKQHKRSIGFCKPVRKKLSFSCCLALIFTGSGTITPGYGQYILEGKIEHAASLPPVEKHWQAGKRFDPGKLPITGSHSLSWWWVPEWLAGTWRNSGKLKRLSLKDLEKTDEDEGFNALDIKYPDSEVIGYQSDKKGAVWTCVPVPYLGRTEQNEKINLSIVHAARPVDLSEKQVVLRFLATTITVARGKGKIENVVQRESLQIYRPIENGRVLVQASMKFFDEKGNARYESKVIGHAHRELPYKETPYLPYPGSMPTLIDLRRSFDKYLRQANLESLIPERVPLPPPKGYRLITP